MSCGVATGRQSVSELRDDMERLADIGDEVLAGTPIESFELGECELAFVLGYCKRAVEEFFADVEPC
jgi:hypothetical protein